MSYSVEIARNGHIFIGAATIVKICIGVSVLFSGSAENSAINDYIFFGILHTLITSMTMLFTLYTYSLKVSIDTKLMIYFMTITFWLTSFGTIMREYKQLSQTIDTSEVRFYNFTNYTIFGEAALIVLTVLVYLWINLGSNIVKSYHN